MHPSLLIVCKLQQAILCQLYGDAVDGQVDCVGRDEMLQVLIEMKAAKVPGPSDVS